MITIGEIHKSLVIDDNDDVKIKMLVDLGTTVDERITDGFYFAKTFKLVKYLCDHPEFLDVALEVESNYDYK